MLACTVMCAWGCWAGRLAVCDACVRWAGVPQGLCPHLLYLHRESGECPAPIDPRFTHLFCDLCVALIPHVSQRICQVTTQSGML